MKNLTGYISNYEEAVLIMHAIRLGFFAPQEERLKPEDRERIESSDIFCFIENENGMKRWTDGRIWSPSKICGEFLVYQEVPKYLSKNSIKKRKHREQQSASDSLLKREEIVDRTTLHKKTISIQFKKHTYHIISYYRPIFANYSLINIPFFQKLSEALNLYPELKDDNFIRENRQSDPEFYKKFNIEKIFERNLMEESKRIILEQVAAEVLGLMWKKKSSV